MPRSFDLSVESPASVEQAHAAFADEEYWLARLEAFGGVGRLDSLTVGDDGTVTVAIIQDLRHDLMPGLVAKFYPGDLEVLHDEKWGPVGRGRMRGEISISARGFPGTAVGAVLLARQDREHRRSPGDRADRRDPAFHHGVDHAERLTPPALVGLTAPVRLGV
jgi:hypothetical protein